jgi:hypothetical protein
MYERAAGTETFNIMPASIIEPLVCRIKALFDDQPLNVAPSLGTAVVP